MMTPRRHLDRDPNEQECDYIIYEHVFEDEMPIEDNQIAILWRDMQLGLFL